jgi:uncharacterized protein YcbK (DUF882 family)
MMTRRAFLKQCSIGVASLSLIESVNADSDGRKNLPLQNWSSLLLMRNGQQLKLDLNQHRHYMAACYLLRDTQANISALAHPWLLRTLSYLQATVAQYHTYEPMIINSGFRTPHTNHHVGGAESSFHLANERGVFHAVDISTKQTSASLIGKYALAIQQGGVGVYHKSNFVHIDVGAPISWSDISIRNKYFKPQNMAMNNDL